MYKYKDKTNNIVQLNKYMFNRTLSMFEYENLPATIPPKELEKQLQKCGYSFITEVNGELYALQGGLGGELDAYGNATKITITNAYLNFNETLDIEEDGVLILNDDMMLGLLPLYEKYHTLLIENEITMFINSYNSRVQTLISAGDDSTKESAERYIEKIKDGDLSVIGENRIFDGINVQNSHSNTANITTQLIEFNQYLKASLYNEVGLNANFNMKRERLNTSEVELNTDNLYPLIHNMLDNRTIALEKLNNMYDINSSVDFGSIWQVRDINDTIEEEIEPLDEEIEPLDEEIEPLEEIEPIEELEEPLKEEIEPLEEEMEPIEELEEPLEEEIEEDGEEDAV